MYQPYPIKIKATLASDKTEVLLLMPHHMESGRRINVRGEKIPKHFIHTVKIYLDKQLLILANLNYTISENPKWKFAFNGGKKGDEIRVVWEDSLGLTLTGTALIE